MQDMGDEEMSRDARDKNTRNQEPNGNGASGSKANGIGAYASFAGNAGDDAERNVTDDKLLGLNDLDPNDYIKNLNLAADNDESAAAALGLGDI